MANEKPASQVLLSALLGCTHTQSRLQPCKHLNDVLALVDELVRHITQCNVALLDPAQAAAWADVHQAFTAMDAEVQQATQNLIHSSFRCLAAGAALMCTCSRLLAVGCRVYMG